MPTTVQSKESQHAPVQQWYLQMLNYWSSTDMCWTIQHAHNVQRTLDTMNAWHENIQLSISSQGRTNVVFLD
eukprot:1075692-Amphidinium_carterae.1